MIGGAADEVIGHMFGEVIGEVVGYVVVERICSLLTKECCCGGISTGAIFRLDSSRIHFEYRVVGERMRRDVMGGPLNHSGSSYPSPS